MIGVGRHRARAARIVLPRLFGASSAVGDEPSLLFSRAPRARRRLLAALAPGRLRPSPRRLRHEDGPRAAPHLEARRLRRGAGNRRGAPRGRADELRVPRASPRLPDRATRPAKGPSRASLLVALGLLSMAVAAAFMVRQRDFKRMLAYSSVEHMGILVLGIGLGGLALFGALLHSINNGLTKGVLFLAAGNIHRAYRSKNIDDVSGAIARAAPLRRALPRRLLRHHRLAAVRPVRQRVHDPHGAVAAGHFVVAALFLVLLVVIFIGMGATVLAVVQGPVSPAGAPRDSLRRQHPEDGADPSRGPRPSSSGPLDSRPLCEPRRGRPPPDLEGTLVSGLPTRNGTRRRARRTCPASEFDQLPRRARRRRSAQGKARRRRTSRRRRSRSGPGGGIDLVAVLADDADRAASRRAHAARRRRLSGAHVPESRRRISSSARSPSSSA